MSNNLLLVLTVSQDTHDEDILEAELMAFLKGDHTAVGVSSPTKQTTDEDELEARLASLSIGADQQEKGTAGLDQHEPGGRDKSQTSTKRLKVQPLPA